jgi:hypothetical protein
MRHDMKSGVLRLSGIVALAYVLVQHYYVMQKKATTAVAVAQEPKTKNLQSIQSSREVSLFLEDREPEKPKAGAFETHNSSHLTCPSPKLPSVSFAPRRFLERYTEFEENLRRNRKSLKDGYIAIGDRSSGVFSVYYHIHKAGGTTMFRTKFPRQKTYHHPLRSKIGETAFRNVTKTLVGQVANSSPDNAVLFTFVRDPATRFLSGLGQLLSMWQRVHKVEPCLAPTTISTPDFLHCMLDLIENDGRNFLDPHLVPQAYELVSAVQDFDLEMRIFDLSQLNDVLGSCGAGNKDVSKHYMSQTHDKKQWDDYPNLSMSANVLTPDLLQRICKLYHVDVLMLHELGGITKTMCTMTIRRKAKNRLST